MDYTPIYDRYNGELRPLISEFEGREEQFEEPILKNMAYVVDELSLCVQSEDPVEQMNHFKTAKQNLEEAVTNTYKYLVVSHHKQLKKFKRRFSKQQMQHYNNGKFIGKFTADSKKAIECTRHARKQIALLDAEDDFKKAYTLYSNIEHEISDFEAEGAVLEPLAKSVFWTAVKMVLSVAVSIGVAYYFTNCSL